MTFGNTAFSNCIAAAETVAGGFIGGIPTTAPITFAWVTYTFTFVVDTLTELLIMTSCFLQNLIVGNPLSRVVFRVGLVSCINARYGMHVV